MPKTCEKPFYRNIRLVLRKKPFEKTPNIREMRPFWKSAISGKGYSPCKMVSLGQKLKMPKTCKKTFFKNIQVVLRKKPFEKTPNIRENRRLWKWAISGKGYSPCKGYSPWKMVSLGQKVKMPKTCEKPFYRNIRVVLRKKPFQTTPNIREMRPIWKSAISGKGYSPCKGHSLCKMVSLGQKLKMLKTCEKPFFKNIRVVLCKKPLQKTTNIREMRPFWK